MQTSPHTRYVRILTRYFALSSVFFACPAWGAQFQATVSVGVDQIYTDNINLAPSGQEKGEWVTQLRPGITVSYNGPKLKFDANYTAELLYYASTGETSLRHQFSGGSGGATKTSWELVPDLLHLDTSVGVSQRTTTLLGPQAQSNFNTVNYSNTINRETVVTAVASPYLRYVFEDYAVATARYTYSLVGASGNGGVFVDSGGNRFDARLESGPSRRQTRWLLSYYRDVLDYQDIQNDVTFELFTAGIQQLVANNVSVTANVGYEKNDYATTGADTSGVFWNTGLIWTPTPRTNFAASYGKRYYGTTYALDFSHRMRLLSFNVNYSEHVTNTRGLLTQSVGFNTASTASAVDTLFLSRIPDPILRQQAVQQFITQSGLPPNLIVPVDFFTSQVFLAKTWRAGVGFSGMRHSVFANFYTTTRETQQAGVLTAGAGDFAFSSTIKQSGVSGTWSWRLSAVDSTNLTLGYARNEFPAINREDDITYFYWTYSRQFSPKLSGGLNYRRLNSESNLPGPVNFKENAVLASLRMTF